MYNTVRNAMQFSILHIHRSKRKKRYQGNGKYVFRSLRLQYVLPVSFVFIWICQSNDDKYNLKSYLFNKLDSKINGEFCALMACELCDMHQQQKHLFFDKFTFCSLRMARKQNNFCWTLRKEVHPSEASEERQLLVC